MFVKFFRWLTGSWSLSAVVVTNLLTASFFMWVGLAIIQKQRGKYEEILPRGEQVKDDQECVGVAVGLANKKLSVDAKKGFDLGENWQRAKAYINDRGCKVSWEELRIFEFPNHPSAWFIFKPQPLYK